MAATRCHPRRELTDSRRPAHPQLLTISHTALDYITKKAQFAQPSEKIPITTAATEAAKRKDYERELFQTATVSASG